MTDDDPNVDPTVDPTARDVDSDLSVWDEHDEPEPLSEPTGDHPLGEPLALVADVAERLQTWASDLSSALRKRGGRMTKEEVEEGRQLSLQAKEAFIVAIYLGRHM